MTIQHKALLAAAATDGVHAVDGYDEKFGYGTLAVDGFVPETTTGTVRALNEIAYEVQPSTTYQNAQWEGLNINLGGEDSEDWVSACIILAVFLVGIYIIKNLRFYVLSKVKRGETNDEQ